MDGEEDAAQEAAGKLRRKAGLPEVQLDGLPSASAIKMLNLIEKLAFELLSWNFT